MADLLDQLDFEPTDVVETARLQPGKFMQAAALRIEHMEAHLAAKQRAAAAKSALEELMAGTAVQIRDDADPGEKISEASMKERLLTSDVIIEARAALLGADAEEDKFKCDDAFASYIVDAYKQRKDVLQMCATLLGGEQRNITGMEKITRSELADRTKKRFPKGS